MVYLREDCFKRTVFFYSFEDFETGFQAMFDLLKSSSCPNIVPFRANGIFN